MGAFETAYQTDMYLLLMAISVAISLLGIILYWNKKGVQILFIVLIVGALTVICGTITDNNDAKKHTTTHTVTYQISSIEQYDEGYSLNTTKKVAFNFNRHNSTGYKAGDIIKITYKKTRPNIWGDVAYSLVKIQKEKSTGTYTPIEQTDSVIWGKFRQPFD